MMKCKRKLKNLSDLFGYNTICCQNAFQRYKGSCATKSDALFRCKHIVGGIVFSFINTFSSYILFVVTAAGVVPCGSL